MENLSNHITKKIVEETLLIRELLKGYKEEKDEDMKSFLFGEIKLISAKIQTYRNIQVFIQNEKL